MNEDMNGNREFAGFLRRFGATALCLIAIGCSHEPFPMVQVEGKITYEDGTPIPADGITLRFVPLVDPLDAKTHARPGNAEVAADGTFHAVTSHKYNDGIVRGRHKVLVKAAADQPVVPEKYRRPDETPLEIDSGDSPFHFKIERP